MYFEDSIASTFKEVKYDYFEKIDKGHRRIEKRKYWITDDITWLYPKSEWVGLKSIGIAKHR